MKLYEIPNGSPLMVKIKGEIEKQPATFHHIDGMYSLCTFDNPQPGECQQTTFHLPAMQEMKLVGGHHYELVSSRKDG